MQCKQCGAEMGENASFCPSCGHDQKKKKRKKPFILFRPILRLASFLIYLLLLVSLLATVLLTDVYILTNPNGIKTILSHVVSAEEAPAPSSPTTAAPALTLLSTVTVSEEVALSEESLVAMVQEMAEQILGEDVPISAEQIAHFIKESTFMEFVAGKAAIIVEQSLTNELGTTPLITPEDILQLIEDNEELIEETFQIDITDQTKQEMALQIDTALADADVNAALQNGIAQTLQTPIPGTKNLTVQDVMEYTRRLAQPIVILIGYAVCLLLIGLLFAFNSYRPYRGLNRAGSACVAVGSLLSLPLALLQFTPALISGFLPETGNTIQLFNGAAAVMAPVHYGLTAVGMVMLIVAFVWQKLRRND